MSEKTAVIIGVGAINGMGGQLCKRFASLGLHVVIAGRTQGKIDKVAEAIRADGGRATAIACDGTIEADVKNLIAEAAKIGPIDLAIFNTGNNMPGHLIGMEADYFEECWRLCTFGGFLFAREVATHMEQNGTGTILFTGATAAKVGNPMFVAFTAAKAGLRTMAQAMAKDLSPKGIHIGHVVIDGAIDGNRIRKGLPQLVERWGEDRLVELGGIVDIYEMLYKQPKRAWTFEVDVRSSVAEFGIQ